MGLNLLFNKYVLIAAFLFFVVIGFVFMKYHYIHQGELICQAKIALAINAEKDRVNKINDKLVRESSARAVTLEIENETIKEKISKLELEDIGNADNACYSASQLRGINSIQR